MLKKLFFKLSVWLDTLKGFLIFLVVWALIIFFGSMIVHHILKMGELSNTYKGEYKTLVEVDDDKMMNVVVFGEGEKTIVILPGFGSQSPVIQYKAIADALKDSYRVAIVEYYGYGYSMVTNKERTLNNIADEVQSALNQSGIYEYILMPHSLSNIYAMKMVYKYPESVKGVISLDGLYPAQYNENYYYDEYLDELHNVELTAILELSGFARILSYVQPDLFYINKMTSEGVWGQDEVAVLRNRIATSYLTSTMIDEMQRLRDNSLEIVEYKHPEGLPVLQILSSETAEKYSKNKEKDLIKKDLKELAVDIVTNSELQTTVVLKGTHELQYNSYNEIGKLVKEFIDSGKTDEVYYEVPIIEEVVEEQEDSEEVEQTEETEDVQEEQTGSLESMIEVVPAPGEKVENEVEVEESKNEIKAEVNKNTNIYDPNAAKSSSSDVVVVEINN